MYGDTFNKTIRGGPGRIHEPAEMNDGPGLDAAPLALLRDYAALLGAPVVESEHTVTLDLPESEAGFFRSRRLMVARAGSWGRKTKTDSISCG